LCVFDGKGASGADSGFASGIKLENSEQRPEHCGIVVNQEDLHCGKSEFGGVAESEVGSVEGAGNWFNSLAGSANTAFNRFL